MFIERGVFKYFLSSAVKNCRKFKNNGLFINNLPIFVIYCILLLHLKLLHLKIFLNNNKSKEFL